MNTNQTNALEGLEKCIPRFMIDVLDRPVVFCSIEEFVFIRVH